MKKVKSLGMFIVAGIMWWGLVYPELCFMEGTYETAAATAAAKVNKQLTIGVLEETEEAENANTSGHRKDSDEIRSLFEAGPDKMIVKSKIIRNGIQ